MNDLIPRDWRALPEAIRSRLGSGPGRQRAMIAEGHLLLILHGVPEPGVAERRGRLFWRDAAGFWRADDGTHGADEVARLIAAYRQAIEQAEQAIGEAASADDWFAIMRRLRPLVRSSRHLLAAVQDAREGVADKALISLRDAAQANERMAELALADAQAGLDLTVARRVEDHARAQHRLNILAAIFFPITAIGTIFGMNMHHGLEAGPTWWFWTATIAAFLAGAGVTIAVTMRRTRPRRRDRPAPRRR